MQRTPGLYVTLQKDGIIKRTLVTNKGENVLDKTTIGAELIWFAELDFNTYLDSLINIEELAEKTEDDGDPENYGTVYLDTFDKLLTEANELVYDIEDLYPALGSLLRFDLLDHTPKDDGTAMYVYHAKYKICEHITEPVISYIQLREVLEDLSFGIPLDFDEKYANLAQGAFIQCYTFTGTMNTEYRFRSIKNYFQFLLIHYLNSNPNVARCFILFATVDNFKQFKNFLFMNEQFMVTVNSLNNRFRLEECRESIRHTVSAQSRHTFACRLIRVESKSYHLRNSKVGVLPFFIRLVLC